MTPLLPLGTVTFPTNNDAGGTSIDLVWGNVRAEECVLKCHTIEAINDHTSDHFPIEVLLDLEHRSAPPIKQFFNYAKTNWDLIKTKLEIYLPYSIDPYHITEAELDTYSELLVNAIHIRT